MKKILLSFVAVCALTFGLNAQVQNYSVGQTVDDFTVTDVHGNTHNLAAIAASGKTIFLDFFFTTCPPCQATVPFYSELHETYGCNGGDIYLISIDSGDDDAEVLAFETTYAMSSGHAPAPAASGTEGGGDAVVAAFGIGAYPTYCIIGSDMKLKNADVWPVSSMADMETALTGAGVTLTPMACGVAGLTEQVAQNTFDVYPNPAVSNATLAISLDEATTVTVSVYNLVGGVVATDAFEGSIGANAFELNVSDLVNGKYIVKMNFENGTSAQTSLNVLR